MISHSGGSFAVVEGPSLERASLPTGDGTAGCHAFIRIDNLSQIEVVFGGVISELSVEQAGSLIRDAFPCDELKFNGQGCFHLHAKRPAEILEAELDAFCFDIAIKGISAVTETLHLILSTAIVSAENDLQDVGRAEQAVWSAPFSEAPIPSSASWVERYREDMSLVVELFDAAAKGCLVLAWQPICGGYAGDKTLYHEGLARRVDCNGQLQSCGEMVRATERLGLAHAFDRLVIALALAALEQDPDICLGINISAHSASLNYWWRSFLSDLAKRRSIAKRLVFEITETGIFPPAGLVTEFVDSVRRTGSRIAIDDFGVGHSSIRLVVQIVPDIIKIDALFLKLAMGSSSARTTFFHLVNLAASIASCIVIEGVELREQREIATAAGAVWLQGYHIGHPAMFGASVADGTCGYFVPTSLLGEAKVGRV